MSAPDFLDTNILVYAYDASNRTKRTIAQRLLQDALAGRFLISTQVLNELSATLLYKTSPPMKPANLTIILDALTPLRVIPIEPGIVRRAVEAREKYGIHFYDGMIVAAAEKAGCPCIWSEDLNPGQSYFGVQLKNPFKLPS